MHWQKCYGFKGDGKCVGFVAIENGECIDAGTYDDRTLNWDLRADEANWNKWLKKELGMTGLGKGMISDPRMAGPFIKSFAAMGRV